MTTLRHAAYWPTNGWRRSTPSRAARAWQYREQLREILDRKQINIVTTLLRQWCTNVLRSKVEPMQEVAHMIRKPIKLSCPSNE